MENICPVCEYKGLYTPPYDKHGRGSDEICPCCGFHFGLDDFKGKEEAFVKWRNEWARNGCKWFSKFRLPPPDFNPVVLTLDFDEPDDFTGGADESDDYRVGAGESQEPADSADNSDDSADGAGEGQETDDSRELE